ncbi:MAG: GGDEF domain-containing protein [Pseudobutyrivibrio sp.]|nr:GGDEF domain-containing protein [Pseudobutyrivibrio sp.]
MSFREKVVSLFLKDIDDKNDTKKPALLMRFFTTDMVILLLIHLVIFLVYGHHVTALLAIIAACVFTLIFYGTYTKYLKTQYVITVLGAYIWILTSVFIYGWDAGIQHFLYVLLVFAFMAGRINIYLKIAFSVFLCATRIALFWYTDHYDPYITLDPAENILLQLANTISIFVILTCLVTVFSQDQLSMEKKLIDYNKQVKEQASIDPLTGLINRRATMERVHGDNFRSKDNDFRNIAIGDIDFFKRVNDTYGHATGDELLIQLAQMFTAAVGSKGFVARWGGEEFLFVLFDMNGDQALELLTKLRRDIELNTFVCKGINIKVTMTFGLTEWDPKDDFAKVTADADKNLYTGKNSGRNQVVF